MMQEGDYSSAAASIDAMMEDHPDDARLLAAKGIALYGLMDYDGAYILMKKASEEGAGEKDELAKYAVQFMDANRETLRDMQERRALSKSVSPEEREKARGVLCENHIKLLMLLLGKNYYYPALAMAHILWLEKNNAAAEMPGLYRFSAEVYYSAMLYKKASEDFEKALKESPRDAELLKSSADCLVALGDLDKAGEYYARAAELYRKKGGEGDTVADDIDKVRRALPKSYKDVSLLMKEGRYDDAEKALRKRLSLNGADPAAIVQLGLVRWEKGERNEAFKFFTKAAKVSPDYPVSHFYLGKSYAFRNDLKKAMKEFAVFKEKMERLPPMDDDTVDFYVSALHYIGYMYSTAKEYTSAIKEGEKILKLRPKDQDARYNMAIAYYSLGKISRAYGEFNKIIEIDPSSDTADMARYCMDYMRSNPDPRIRRDFSFLNRD
jgi:tetratricopeptide (TPR) repeat protein